MPRQVEIRYRCVVCAGPVTMGHLAFAAMVNTTVTALLQGEGNIEDEREYVAFVCAVCQEDPRTPERLRVLSWPS